MAVTPTPVFPQSIQLWTCSITASQTLATTTPLACVTAGTNGTKIDALWMVNTGSANPLVSMFWAATTTGGPIGAVTATATAGQTGVAHIDILRSASMPALSYDAFGNKIMYLSSGTVLSFMANVVPTAGVVSIFAQGSNF